ncbi:MAG: matrixin family metalloprotease, partial [Chitinophagales bacterium]
GSGGYTFQLDNTFAANTDAVNSFKRALNTWTCKTGVNMTVSDTPTTADCTVPAMGPPSPGVNYVSFDNTCPVSAGLAGQARYFISGCTIGADTYAYISEIDVYIGNTVPWNYGTDCPDMNAIDFQSVMLHELGHGFGMGHVVNTGEVMFPSVVSGTHNRNLDQGALSCMSAVMAHSTTMGTCAINAMTQTTVCTPNQVSVEATVLLEGAYQSATNMNVNLRNPLNVIPLIQPFNQAPWNYAGTEAFATLGDLPANAVDWVLVEVRNAQTKCVEEQKAAILMGDGSLKDVDATVTSGVAFTTLNYCSNYYLSIKHRNHIAVMSSQVVTVPNVGSPYNFTATGAVEGGDTQMKEVATGIFAMKGGDYNSDGVVNTDDNTALVAAVGSAGSYLLTDGDLNAYVTVSDFNVQNNNQGTNGTVLCQ